MNQLEPEKNADRSDEMLDSQRAVISGPEPEPPDSPRWSTATKLVVGLALVAIFAFLLFRFLNLVGPLLMAFILAYLFYPLAEKMHREGKITWRVSVTILYVIFLVLIIGSLTLGGLTVIEQIQNLIHLLTNAIDTMPQFIARVVAQPLQVGPFTFDLSQLDVNNLTDQILGMVQPVLSRVGSSAVSVASGTASLIGWTFFILLISYFILAESGGFRLINLSIPGHAEDFNRLGKQLGRIWNAFLRGQITIVLLTILAYTIVLGILGIKYYFGLALLAGLARFIPYVGPFIAWTTYGLVAFFQGSTIFDIDPLAYVGLVVGLAWIMDLIIDNYVTPLLMSTALKVHPAAVMVSALIALNLLGVIGVVLAAPVLATVKLVLNYIFAKLFDRDPWDGMETISRPFPLSQSLHIVRARFQTIRERIIKTRLPGSK
jgi:predicted PurR-regulated permease PerM